MTGKDTGLDRRSFLKKSLTGLAAVGAVPAAVKAAALGTAGRGQAAAAPAKPIIRTLGKTGLRIPVVSMGVMNADNPAVVEAALETGITFLDTAWGYQRGRNEQMIGQVIKGRPRDAFMIATKIPGPNRERGLQGLTGDAFEKAFLAKFDESLGRLGLDFVEILYLHNNTTPETVQDPAVIAALQKVKKAGKARFIGITTHGNEPAVIRATVATKAYDVILTGYNFQKIYRDDLRKAVAEATAAGLGIVAMKTQAGGAYWDKAKTQPINMRAALKWVLNDPNVTTAVPGFTTFDQLKDDWSVVSDITLTPEELKDLRLGEQVAGLYCQHCSRCVPGCPKGLPIPDLMRSYMYAYGYRNLQAAHELVGSLDLPAEPCGSCAACSAVCAKGLDIAERVRDISRLRAVPGDFFV